MIELRLLVCLSLILVPSYLGAEEGSSSQEESANATPLMEDSSRPKKNSKEESESYLQPVSLDFKGASLREVIRALSAETHINFILPDRVGNLKVYISLKNVPWDKALQAILETNGLGIVKMSGDVVRIDELALLDKEKQDTGQIRQRAALTTPTKVLVVRLSYAKASNLVKIITNMLPSAAFDKRVKVDSDDRTNSVVVEAIPQELSKIRSLIERIDLQTPQVRIESRVIEILKTSNNLLGINWGAPFNYDQGRGLGFGNLVFPNNIISAFSVDTGATSAANTNGKFDIHVGSLNNITALDLRLRMGELTDQTRSLQNNNVLVVDGEQASIEAGTEDYFQIPTGDGQTAMTSVSYLLSLKVTPHITADGAVQMLITVENSSPTKPSSTAAASKSTRTLTTNMLRKTGETAVIGGLYTTSYEDTRQGFPYLMDIPILGVLFRSTATTETRRELIILVTPTIVNGNERVILSQREKLGVTPEPKEEEVPVENINPLSESPTKKMKSIDPENRIDPLEDSSSFDSKEIKSQEQGISK